ncbi:NifU family protein [Candidatus Magnetomonas plexicatena]|uniref:NifU family protein n=1 Tax=Candidatus Magnetomonas plexicatena TaxID=2552947 RepID=UPI00110362A5|nr:NifU family protein [Nitrospirales bacterium LBB_01]
MDKDAIEKVIEKVREGLKPEGGDIELISEKDGVLYVRLTGSCESCPMSGLTMTNWVEKTLLEGIPGLKGVKAV